MEKLHIPPFFGFHRRPDITVSTADGEEITLPGYVLWATELWPLPISVHMVCGGYSDRKPLLGYVFQFGRRRWYIRMGRQP
jgi:hypothetical protein